MCISLYVSVLLYLVFERIKHEKLERSHENDVIEIQRERVIFSTSTTTYGLSILYTGGKALLNILLFKLKSPILLVVCSAPLTYATLFAYLRYVERVVCVCARLRSTTEIYD